jgi:hypothetical protein
VRPGWFDAGTGSERRVDLHGDATEYGPLRREHVAETLAQALRVPTAVGPDLSTHDRTSLTFDHEPARVRADLRRWTTTH